MYKIFSNMQNSKVRWSSLVRSRRWSSMGDSFTNRPASTMNVSFVTPIIQVGRSEKRRRSNIIPNPQQRSYCCLKGPERTRATQREHAPEFSQSTARKLSGDLLARGILQDSDVKLFETFTDSRAELFLRVLSNRTRHITFVLDGVHGAHNLAAIARSCDAWGVQDLHLIAQSERLRENGRKGNPGKGWSSTSLIDRFEKDSSVQKVSKNSHKWLTIKEHDGVEACMKELKSSGYKVLVSSLSPSATAIQELDVSAKCAFVFGNECCGISNEMEARADGLFTIPMMGFVESMNVSVAVGTTASLTITRSQATVPSSDYALSINEKRELAHVWLKNRFSAKGAPRTLSSSQDVTRLGPRCERRILQNGLFEESDDHCFDPRNPKTITIRLSADAGLRLVTYVNRRKFGALGDGRFDKRCGTITHCLAGVHTLSCGAVLASYESCWSSRSKLFKYFKMVCDRITDLYAPYFDSAGNPVLPTFAPESQQTFDKLSEQATHEAWPVCLELAQDLFDLDASTMRTIIERASYQDLSRCVTDTLRLSSEFSEVFQSEVMRTLAKLPDLMQALQEREPIRKLSSSFTEESMSMSDDLGELPKEWLAALQVSLRLSHIAFLSSEIHQAVWDRSTKRNHLARVHSLRFGLLESILCEAWAESVTVPSFVTMGPLRLVVEGDQALTALKLALKPRKGRDTNMYLFHEAEVRKNHIIETANLG